MLLKSLTQERYDIPLVIVGAPWVMTMAQEIVGRSWPEHKVVQQLGETDQPLSFYPVDQNKPDDFSLGCVHAACGSVAVKSIECVARACLDGKLAGMVTAPINKESVQAAGFTQDIGHQEILSRITGATSTATMLMTPGLKVVHLSTHKSLVKAAQFVTHETVLERLLLTHTSLTNWGLKKPHIAVAALNPHGGEGGLIGREEIDEIAPAIVEANERGLKVSGPIPADSVFNRAINGEFDVVLALYHDQGHIAIKVHNFHESTTATLGLPFVRTSVDHGTAFDIAGSGEADPTGMTSAIHMAQTLLAQSFS